MKSINIDDIAKQRARLALIGIFFLIIPVALFMGRIKYSQNTSNLDVVNGYVVVDNCDDLDGTVYTLNGTWNYINNEYVTMPENIEKLNNKDLINVRSLPENKLSEVKESRTYMLDMKMTKNIDEDSRIAIAIPFLHDDVQVFLNGEKLEHHEPFESWLGTDIELQMFLLRDYVNNEEEIQKLVITVNENGDNYGLYKREVMISEVGTFYEHLQVQDGLENLLIGMMIISILMGWINMLVLPGHSMLTTMTMFDTTLMLYFFFEVSRLPIHTVAYFTDGQYGEKIIRGMVIGLFCLTGYWGNRISREIFDPGKEIEPLKDVIIGRVWLFGALLNFIFPESYGNEAIICTLIFYIFTMEIVLKRMSHCKKNGRYTRAMQVQAYKAMYVGGLLGYDIITTNIYPRNNIVLIVGYGIFFFLEFMMRANVQKETFDITKQAKLELEKKVEERTEKLNKANDELVKLMHVDPLTNAYNRLYFEENLLEEIERNNKQNYHLCLFDLDNFKLINDTFGHHVGDEQLIEAVEAVKRIIEDKGVISRIGGEEFMILFKELSDNEVLNMVENIRASFELMAMNEGRTTGSFGVAKFLENDNRKTAFIRVDQCLYHSKNNGKNCITYEFNERMIYGDLF